MAQNQLKIQEKFYPLQHEEWLRNCRQQSKAENSCSDFEINVTFEEVR